ncbi:CPBP family intramembrane glutamic endopeptidase [Thermopirellula anaerolimosa]
MLGGLGAGRLFSHLFAAHNERMRPTPPFPPLNTFATAPAPLRILIVGAGFELALGLLAWSVGFLVGRDPFSRWRWTWQGLAWGGAAVVPMLAMAGMALQARGKPWQELRDFLDDVIAPLFLRCRAWHLLALSVAAGWGEELLFRGLLQQGLTHVLTAWGLPSTAASAAALLVAALLFGLAHPLTRLYVVGATVLGAYLGLCFELSGNLLVPAVAHAGYDFLVLAFLVRRARVRETLRQAAGLRPNGTSSHPIGGQDSAATVSTSGDST